MCTEDILFVLYVRSLTLRTVMVLQVDLGEDMTEFFAGVLKGWHRRVSSHHYHDRTDLQRVAIKSRYEYETKLMWNIQEDKKSRATG